jgi:hypothetical protein
MVLVDGKECPIERVRVGKDKIILIVKNGGLRNC